MSSISNDSWLTAGMRHVMQAAAVAPPGAATSSDTQEDLNALYAMWNAYRLAQQSPLDYAALQIALGSIDTYQNMPGLDPTIQAMIVGALNALLPVAKDQPPTDYAAYIENNVAAQTVTWMNSNQSDLSALMAPGTSDQNIFEFTNIMMGLSTTKNGQGAANIDGFFAELSNPPTPIMLLAYFYEQDGDDMTKALADLKAYAATLPQPPAGVNAPNYEKLLQEIQWTINNPPSAAYFSYYMQQEDAAIEKWLGS